MNSVVNVLIGVVIGVVILIVFVGGLLLGEQTVVETCRSQGAYYRNDIQILKCEAVR